VRAWLTIVKDWAESESVCLAKTRGAARYSVWSSCRECGYSVGFGDIIVRRIPEYDGANIPPLESTIRRFVEVPKP
jgi:hypothetical protein